MITGFILFLLWLYFLFEEKWGWFLLAFVAFLTNNWS